MKTAILSALLTMAAPTVTLHPAQLDRGPDVSGPHVEGRVLVDGSTRISFRDPVVTLLGTSRDHRYVVHLMTRAGNRERVIAVGGGAPRRVLLRGVQPAEAILSDDGRDLLAARWRPGTGTTTVRVLSARTGRPVAHRQLRGAVSLLDADASRVVLGGWRPARTLVWNYRSGSARLVNHHSGYLASLAAGRLASYTGDPYDGGCSVLTTLGGQQLSRSCSERVVAISPSGRRVATVGLLSDGPGSSATSVRRASGRLLVTYRAPYVFGTISWQDDRTLLLDTLTTRRATVVRCVLDTCERASASRPSPIN
ncbi:hypothetical protein [Nocardioides sp.]|uniref:hypothetical protein n=1 Tax=Nocardioides sp. TaxID=35761 RepID=UPI0037832AE0